MGIFIQVQATPGDHINEVLKEMLALANLVDFPVKTDFNDRLVWVHPGDGIEKLRAKYVVSTTN